MKKFLLLSSTLAGAALLPGMALAADTAANAGGIEEIVVTAQKTRTLENKTPISMEVLSSNAVAEKGISDIAGLATQDASVNFVSGGGEGVVGIRGIATQNTTEVGDPSVPVSTDGFFLSRPYTFNESLYDVSRIEVLRGPQGTLYGRNATGGVINIIDTDPGTTFGGYEEVTIGNYGTINSTGAVDLPVTDKFQARLAYTTLDHDGYRNNGAAGKGDDQDSKSARLKLAWEPADNFKALVTLQYTHVGGTGPTDEVIALNSVNGVYSHNVVYTGNGSSFPLVQEPKLSIDEKAVRWNLVWSDLPGNTTLTYLGGYDILAWHRLSPQSVAADNEIDMFSQNEAPKTQNHEIHLSSSQDQRLVWQIGGFYYNEDNALNTALQTNYGGPTQGNFVQFKYKVHDDSAAGFGQATYKLTDEVSLTGGLRYTRDSKTRLENFALPEFGLFFPQTFEQGSWSKVTWHAGIDYNPSPDLLIYGKADKGYKSGGFSGISNPQYAPETVIAYEVGAKDRLFNGLLSVNSDFFYEDYSNQQLTTFVPLTQNGATAVLNAGSSTIYGLDISGRAKIDPIGRFDLSATLLHARFDNNIILAGIPVGGEQLPQAPNLSLTAGLEHTFELAKGGLTLRGETKFVSPQSLHIYNDLDSRVAAHTVSNMYLRYDSEDGVYLVELYVKNLENSTVLSDAAENVGGKYNFYNYGFDPPRTYGVRLRANF